MDSTDAEKVILEHILEGSPRFWALVDAYISPRSSFLLCRTDLIFLSFKPVRKQGEHGCSGSRDGPGVFCGH